MRDRGRRFAARRSWHAVDPGLHKQCRAATMHVFRRHEKGDPRVAFVMGRRSARFRVSARGAAAGQAEQAQGAGQHQREVARLGHGLTASSTLSIGWAAGRRRPDPAPPKAGQAVIAAVAFEVGQVEAPPTAVENDRPPRLM